MASEERAALFFVKATGGLMTYRVLVHDEIDPGKTTQYTITIEPETGEIPKDSNGRAENPRRSEAIKLTETYVRQKDRPEVPTTENYVKIMEAVRAYHMKMKGVK